MAGQIGFRLCVRRPELDQLLVVPQVLQLQAWILCLSLLCQLPGCSRALLLLRWLVVLGSMALSRT